MLYLFTIHVIHWFIELIDHIIITFWQFLGPQIFFSSIIVSFVGGFLFVCFFWVFFVLFLKSSYVVKMSYLTWKYFCYDFSHRRNVTNSSSQLEVTMLLPAMVWDPVKFYSLFPSGRSNYYGWHKQKEFTCPCIVKCGSEQVWNTAEN